MKSVLSCFSLIMLLIHPYLTNANELQIVGWPLPFNQNQTDLTSIFGNNQGVLPLETLWLGEDPVLGRLSCPPLVHLDLSTQIFEPLLLKTISNNETNTIWELGVKDGIYWWNGEKVTSQHILDFLKANLKAIVNLKMAGLVDLPDFKISLQGLTTVKLIFASPSQVGPYILAGAPLFRAGKFKNKDEQFMCAGNFRMISTTPLTLEQVPEYHSGLLFETIKILSQEENKAEKNKTDSHIVFLSSKDLFEKGNVAAKDQLTLQNCGVEVPTGYYSLISWNEKSSLANNPEKRKKLTEALPRGNLLRSSAHGMGELVSAPIPRIHPGYNEFVKVIPYTNPLSDKQEKGKTRVHTLNKYKYVPTKLKTANPSPTLFEKVLGDAFFASGYSVKLVDEKETDWDGKIRGIYVSLYTNDLLSGFHSKSVGSGFVSGKSLDEALFTYSLRLSFGHFDKEKLKHVHKIMGTLEGSTLLSHTFLCIQKSKEKYAKINFTNPDWFRIFLNTFSTKK